MIFSSVYFLFLFLPFVFCGYFLLNKFANSFAAKWFLIIASLFFYFVGSKKFFPFFIASVILNFLIGKYLATSAKNLTGGGINQPLLRRIVFILGILWNVGLLGYYKYMDFFITNYNFFATAKIPLKNILLPIGISFFTFQLIAYLVDSYKGNAPSYSLTNYLLFITFFPQLIVGPIVHHNEIIPQFNDETNSKINWDSVARGIFIFTIGLAKKVLLADPLTQNAKSFFDSLQFEMPAIFPSWYHSIEYTISYYFDLSGYADMAIGIALFFNVILPENFNSPYKARNFQDYWQRWHITLSRFLSAYIFKSVYRRGAKFRNYYIAVMATFFVSGFWHGAGWTFIVWGLVNGVFVCIASWMKKRGFSFPLILARCLTLLGIVLTRILFVSKDFKKALLVFEGLFNFERIGLKGTIKEISFDLIVRLLISFVIIFFMPNTKQISEKSQFNKKYFVPICFLAFVSAFFLGGGNSFLYFKF